HYTYIEPLMRVDFRDVEISLKNVQGLIFTSRNALRWVARKGNLKEMTALPAFVVGPATASLAKSLGFRRVFEGGGTARDLLDVINAQAQVSNDKLLHISGKDVASDILPWLEAFGLGAERVIVYDSVSADNISSGNLERMKRGEIDAVLLMSPKTSETWCKLLKTNWYLISDGIPTAFCISDATAEPLKKMENVSVRIAQKPNIEELLALLED
ncbi:MAG: uroporphyrinogen-III synthase, partial [Methyloligellaceae bacterium]